MNDQLVQQLVVLRIKLLLGATVGATVGNTCLHFIEDVQNNSHLSEETKLLAKQAAHHAQKRFSEQLSARVRLALAGQTFDHLISPDDAAFECLGDFLNTRP